jgi:hypothetical protein
MVNIGYITVVRTGTQLPDPLSVSFLGKLFTYTYIAQTSGMIFL